MRVAVSLILIYHLVAGAQGDGCYDKREEACGYVVTFFHRLEMWMIGVCVMVSLSWAPQRGGGRDVRSVLPRGEGAEARAAIVRPATDRLGVGSWGGGEMRTAIGRGSGRVFRDKRWRRVVWLSRSGGYQADWVGSIGSIGLVGLIGLIRQIRLIGLMEHRRILPDGELLNRRGS